MATHLDKETFSKMVTGTSLLSSGVRLPLPRFPVPALPEEQRSQPQSQPRCPPSPEVPKDQGPPCSSRVISAAPTGAQRRVPSVHPSLPSSGWRVPALSPRGLSSGEENLKPAQRCTPCPGSPAPETVATLGPPSHLSLDWGVLLTFQGGQLT